MSCMSKSFFVDTNILVYAHDTTEARKHKSARTWLEFLWRKRSGFLSAQVLAEFSNIALHKLKPGMKDDAVKDLVEAYEAWNPIPTNTQLLKVGLQVQTKYKLSWWDSLILAGAGATGCDYFLSEDLQDRQKIGNLIVVNPLNISPEML